jgi:hypothetical protein
MRVTVDEHLGRLEEELRPENGIEAGYRLSRNTVRARPQLATPSRADLCRSRSLCLCAQVYVWRAVRLLARAMHERLQGLPMIEASDAGHTVRVPDLESLLQKLRGTEPATATPTLTREAAPSPVHAPAPTSTPATADAATAEASTAASTPAPMET